MPSVHTTTFIAAPPARVWAVLTDFDRYADWNPVIPQMRAEARVGATARFRICLEGTPELRFVARVERCDPERAFSWRGGAPLVPALASGHHWFTLAPEGDGTRLTHGEDFQGLLALLVRGKTHARVTRSYDRLNAALKARAEAAPSN
jgi:hypothetical protein